MMCIIRHGIQGHNPINTPHSHGDKTPDSNNVRMFCCTFVHTFYCHKLLKKYIKFSEVQDIDISEYDFSCLNNMKHVSCISAI